MAIPNMISVIYLSKLVKQEITKTNSLKYDNKHLLFLI